jgi:hypothetical protein
VPRPRERLIVLGIVGQYPMAGVAWQAIHYLTFFGKFVPTGAGLLAYATMDEAIDALARVAADSFGAEPVLRRLLADAELG